MLRNYLLTYTDRFWVAAESFRNSNGGKATHIHTHTHTHTPRPRQQQKSLQILQLLGPWLTVLSR